jgi:branched-chain amino acid transport system ATP-binding protein
MLMGGYALRDHAGVRGRAEVVAEQFPLVQERRTAKAGSLSGGEQKIVEIARALMLEPKLTLMDEPSIGLSPKARSLVFQTIGELNAGGWTILLVEQNARSGLAVADRGAVLDGGMVKLVGTGRALLADQRVAELYLGVTGTTQSLVTEHR